MITEHFSYIKDVMQWGPVITLWLVYSTVEYWVCYTPDKYRHKTLTSTGHVTLYVWQCINFYENVCVNKSAVVVTMFIYK